MARDLLHGHLPYTHIFDNKPPGIYFLFAASILLFGNQPLSIHIASSIAVLCGALSTFSLTRKIFDNQRRWIAFYTAYGYVLLTSHSGGLEANTELFLIPLTTSAMALAWPTKRVVITERLRSWRFIFIGLLLGLALAIKPIAISDLSVVLAVTLIKEKRLLPLTYICFGAALPLVAALIPYVYTSQVHAMYLSLFQANSRRIALLNRMSVLLHEATLDLVRLFPLPEVALFAPIALLRQSGVPEAQRLTQPVGVAFFWLIANTSIAFLLGQLEGHFILPLVVPLLILNVLLIEYFLKLFTLRNRSKLFIWRLTVMIVFLIQGAEPVYLSAKIVTGSWSNPRSQRDADKARTIGDFLRKRMGRERTAWIVSPEAPMEYFIAEAVPVTPYIFSQFLSNIEMNKVANVDWQLEVNNIIKSRPKFIVLQVPVTFSQLLTSFQVASKVMINAKPQPLDYPTSLFFAYVQAKVSENYMQVAIVDGLTIYESKKSKKTTLGTNSMIGTFTRLLCDAR